jgi:2-succinyl-6-hydroxy-2,4-cyclohexadiene-1-carboxylate synthase
MPDLRPFLGRVRTRVDLLVGARDQKFVTLAQELSTLIPEARLSVAPDAGHNLLLERPALCESLLVEGEDP